MSETNIDIVSTGSSEDIAILNVRNQLSDELVCNSVIGMVSQIEQQLSPNEQIRRLRMFGHGAPGLICIGSVPATLTLSSAQQVLDQNADKTLRVVHHVIQNDRGQTVRDAYPLLNEHSLQRLTSRFAAGAWAELHACNVAEGALGEALLKSLARMWNIMVKAGTGDQVIGGGLENTVVVAYPNGSIIRRAPPPPPPSPSGGCSVSWQ